MAALLSLAPVGEGWQVGTISDSWVYRCWMGEELARNYSIIAGITIHIGSNLDNISSPLFIECVNVSLANASRGVQCLFPSQFKILITFSTHISKG